MLRMLRNSSVDTNTQTLIVVKSITLAYTYAYLTKSLHDNVSCFTTTMAQIEFYSNNHTTYQYLLHRISVLAVSTFSIPGGNPSKEVSAPK